MTLFKSDLVYSSATAFSNPIAIILFQSLSHPSWMLDMGVNSELNVKQSYNLLATLLFVLIKRPKRTYIIAALNHNED